MLAVFNVTVYPSTDAELPDVVRWAREHIARVHGLAFIIHRAFDTGETSAYNVVGQQKEHA